MLGPQTQHKGTVYGDDENAPETGTRPAGAPLLTYYLLTDFLSACVSAHNSLASPKLRK